MSEQETKPLPVHLAWAAVMGDVRELSKGNRAHNFIFRGIDDVMNAFGPVLRNHRVTVVPSVKELREDSAQSQGGKLTQIVRVIVEYTVVGPAGDCFTGSAAGEANDVSDKATAKAMSVAFRTFMLQAACLPTQDTDPDQEGESLAAPAGPDPDQMRFSIENAAARGPDALNALGSWAQNHGWPDAALAEIRKRMVQMRQEKQ